MPLMMSIDEAARNLSLSRSSIYNLINAGKLETAKVGRRNLIHSERVRKLVELA